jgi:hypothetical protein
MTMTLPLRLMILHFSHMGLTDGLTFITFTSCKPAVALLGGFASPGDPTPCQIIRGNLDRYLVTRQNTDEIHPELSGNMSQNDVVVSDIDPERRIGQCLDDGSLQLNHVAFSQASYLLGLTEPIPEGGQRLPDFTVQHRLAVF